MTELTDIQRNVLDRLNAGETLTLRLRWRRSGQVCRRQGRPLGKWALSGGGEIDRRTFGPLREAGLIQYDNGHWVATSEGDTDGE